MKTKYKNLGEYIRARAGSLGLNTSSLVDEINARFARSGVHFGVSYMNSIVNGQFTPSKKRCHLIAEFFNDDPNIILQLAGFYQPPSDSELVETIAGTASQLPLAVQHLIAANTMGIRDFFNLSCSASEKTCACLLLPSGEVLSLDVPPNTSTKLLQKTLDAALADLVK